MDEMPRPLVVHVTTVPMTLRFLAGHVAWQKAQGFAVAAISSPGPHLAPFAAAAGIDVHAIAMPRRVTPLADAAALLRLVACLRRLRPAIVHAHTPKGGLLGVLAARLAGVPVAIYHLHGLPFATAAGMRRLLLRSSERVSCALARRVLCVSNSLRDEALAARLVAPERIAVPGGGSIAGIDAVRFDPARFPPAARAAWRRAHGVPQAATVLGFVGRLVRDKGIGDLAAAWARLHEAQPAAHLLLVGPPEPQDPVPPAVLAALRADPRVTCTGELPEADLPAAYAAMDLAVLPTWREGFPVTALEAAAMALPLVATSVTGCVDAVVDGSTGVLVPPRDPAALARVLRDLVADPARRAALGAAARARACRDFAPARAFAAVTAEYRRLLAAAGHAVA